MSQQRLLLTALLPFLFLLPTTTSSHCQTFHRSACMKQDTFVPGHNYIGEGVDITSLERKGAYVVDTGRWQGPNGTCKLCRNPLMNGHLQKLPLAGVDWQVVRSCHRQVSSSVENLDVDVANTMAMEVKNDWKVDLGLEMEMNNGREEDPGLPKARVAFAGSRSRMAIYAHEKSREDSYSFVRQEVSCAYYRTMGFVVRQSPEGHRFPHPMRADLELTLLRQIQKKSGKSGVGASLVHIVINIQSIFMQIETTGLSGLILCLVEARLSGSRRQRKSLRLFPISAVSLKL